MPPPGATGLRKHGPQLGYDPFCSLYFHGSRGCITLAFSPYQGKAGSFQLTA